MKISIIIPNYNGEKYLKLCLDSLIMQTDRDTEIFIIDNSSTDKSIEIIRSEYKNINIIQLDKNYGFSKAVNEGIRRSKNEYIVLLNNDTKIEQDFISNLIKCIDADHRIFSCTSKMVRFFEREKIDDAGDEYTILGWTLKSGDGQPISKYSKDREVFSSCAGGAIYRKEVMGKIGYLDESFFAYMEDVDISYRAKIEGYKNMYCNDAIVYHIGSATSGSKYNPFKVRLAARNNIYVLYKNMPIIQLIVNLPFILIGFIIKAIFFYKKGLGIEYMIGLKEGLGTLSKIKKTKFKLKNLINYFKIEFELILNTYKYIKFIIEKALFKLLEK